MSKGGKGGSSTNAKVQVPDQVSKNSTSLSQLGAYSAGYLPTLTSLANWAQDIATGGNVAGANPYDAIGGGAAGLAGKTIGYTTNLGASLDTAPQQFGAFGGMGGTGVTGTGGSTTSASGTPATGNIGTPQYIAAANMYGFTGSPVTVNGVTYTPVYNGQTQQLTGEIANGKYQSNGTTGTNGNFPAMYQGSGGTGSAGQAASTAGSGASGSSGSILGPFLQNAWDAILAEGQGANQLATEGTTMFGQGQSILQQGENMVGAATSGTGLYPSQQAMVDQATASQKAAIQQQMASEGLTSSTQNAQLQGQAAQQGAATAGALIQGNIQLGQAQMSLGENWSQLGVATQQAAISAITTMASQSAGLQGQMWQETMQGYGLVGQFMQTAMSGFGVSNQGWDQFTQASADNAAIAAKQALADQQSSSNGMSSLLGGVGQLLGGSQGGGGGLIGSLGGLLGGAGGGIAAAAGAAGAGTAGVAAIGGVGGAAGVGLSAAATAVGAALSCIVAREVYGTFDDTWKLFREWMMFSAPSPVLKFYVLHALKTVQWLKRNPDWKPLFKFGMDAILDIDKGY